MKKLILAAVLVATAAAPSDAGWRMRMRHSTAGCQSCTSNYAESQTATAWQGGEAVTTTNTASLTVTATGAMAEVNLARARRGLRPFVEDPNLTAAAQACAQYRADRLIKGHTANDFAFIPAGTSASATGAGGLEPSCGWGACCTYENYTYAGAGLAIGRNGVRFMSLFVR